MDLILHWEQSYKNFVNKGEMNHQHDGKGFTIPKNGAKSITLKHRLGHKPLNYSQRTTISVPDIAHINIRWKEKVRQSVERYSNLFINNARVTACIANKRFILPATKNPKHFANTLANILIAYKRAESINIDKAGQIKEKLTLNNN